MDCSLYWLNATFYLVVSQVSTINMAMKKLIRTVTKYKKEIVKGGIYFVLLVVFIQFYLVEACKNYLKGGTTFRSLTENAEFLPAPYITLCFNPHFKPSILEKYGLTWPFSFEDITNMESNMSSKWKLYQSLSFEYRKDFNIGLYHGFPGGDASDPKPKFETKYNISPWNVLHNLTQY